MEKKYSTIISDQDQRMNASAPVIISASRSTDIPAFYAKCFFKLLAKEYKNVLI